MIPGKCSTPFRAVTEREERIFPWQFFSCPKVLSEGDGHKTEEF